ncbi:MAG: alanyl-tRNA synthetase [Chloroflexota bacterium]|jgi:alanyl-tRNA synthetase|nr:alanyl-tRNA synthetase [Chloroflexota bacterium]
MPERTVGDMGAIPFMPASEIRQHFIDFFAARGHEVVPSASLVPAGDQTLLFTNSGMVQFKETLTGAETRSYKRAVDCQRCLRVAGKHNDFEEVGRTTRHHTFFEMLGNWSFGDYFKREAIGWAKELLTEVYGIPWDRLGATTYKDDEEARQYWREVGMPEQRMAIWGDVDKGDDHNFWRMADTGPCGPCSEIHFDRGPHLSEGPHCVPDHDENCPRWLEIWNLVFMEFDQQPDGPRVPLPFKSVDTGMGFERLASVLQGVNTNYDTDIFTPIHEHMRKLLGHDPETFEAERFSYQVIADHIRALTFLVADGVRPANDGRGYVMRKLLRRAVRHGRLLGRTEPFLAELSGVVVDTMKVAYPYLDAARDDIRGVIAAEERQFTRTLEAGVVHFEEALIPITGASEKHVGGVRPELLPADSPVLPGDVAFRLHDTYGFPIDLTVELAAEYGVRVDRPGFDEALNEQRQRSRGGKKAELAGHAEMQALYGQVAERTGATKFLGYETTDSPGRVVAILRDGTDYQDLEAKAEIELRLPAEAEAEIVLDQTPFYAEGGGQVGDQGVLKSESGEVLFTVTDTQRPVAGLIVHRGLLHGRVKVGETLTAEVDKVRRARTMRNHTATHLLHRALRNTVGERARQAGSLVTPDYLRFDFPLERPLSDDEKRTIEGEVRGVVRDNRGAAATYMTMTEAQAAGADAFFDEKYGEQVRVMFVDGYSRELCGGTHCSATGQIGSFVITGERSIGSGMRRIEALTGDGADAYFNERLALLDRAADAAGAKSADQLPARIAELKSRGARGGASPGSDSATESPSALARSAADVDGTRFLSYAAQFGSMKDLQSYAKALRAELGPGVIVLGLEADEPQLFVTVSDDLVSRGVSASTLVGHGAALLDGKGGGRPEMAQARGTRRDRLPSALTAIREALEATLRDGTSGTTKGA